MAAAWVTDAVNVLEDGGLGLPAGFPVALPDQIGLDALEDLEQDQKTVCEGAVEKVATSGASVLREILAVQAAVLRSGQAGSPSPIT